MPKASPIRNTTCHSDDDDDDDFSYVSSSSSREVPSQPSEERSNQRREPVEHDEDTPPSPQTRQSYIATSSRPSGKINVTSLEANQHFQAMVEPTPDVLLLRNIHQVRIKKLADSLGQVVNGTPEDICIIAEYWNEIAEPSRRRGSMKNGVFTMENDSEGVLINTALYLGKDQMYHFPHHYVRSTPASYGRSMVDSTQSAKVVAMGQFGKVYQAFDRRTEQIFAEKIIAIEKFSKNEIVIHSQLEHEHIVKFFGVIRSKLGLHIFMQFAGGGSIQTILRDGRGFVGSGSIDSYLFSQYWSMLYYKQVLSAIHYLHSKNIVHCDIKPSNVVLSCDKRNCFLTDFGEAIIMKNNIGYVELDNGTVGTPNYMSPEVIVSSKYHYASDIWSAACFLLHMLTGKVPWTIKYPQLTEYRYVIGSKPVEIADEIPAWTNGLSRSILLSSFKEEVQLRKTVKELSQLATKNLAILIKTRLSNREATSSSITETSESMEEKSSAGTSSFLEASVHSSGPVSKNMQNELRQTVAAQYDAEAADVENGVSIEEPRHGFNEISSSVSPKSSSFNEPSCEAVRDVEVPHSLLNSEPFSITPETPNVSMHRSNADEASCSNLVPASSSTSMPSEISLSNEPAEGLPVSNALHTSNQNGTTETERQNSADPLSAELELAQLLNQVSVDGGAPASDDDALSELNRILNEYDMQSGEPANSTSASQSHVRSAVQLNDQSTASGSYLQNGLDSQRVYQFMSSTYDQDVDLSSNENQAFVSRECTADDVDEKTYTSGGK